MHAGQTIQLDNGAHGTLSEGEAARRQPQSVALSRVEQRMPRFDGHVVPHSVLGDPEEYEVLRLAHTRDALAELGQTHHPSPMADPAEAAARQRPSSLWGGRGVGQDAQPSSVEARPSPRGRPMTITERVGDARQLNEQRTWEKWDLDWHRTQERLSERFGKPVEKLILNSNEVYNNRVRFLDLLERSHPPHLDENKRFMMAVRRASTRCTAPLSTLHALPTGH